MDLPDPGHSGTPRGGTSDGPQSAFLWVFWFTASVTCFVFIFLLGSWFLQGDVAQVAEGCFAAGAGESGPSRCSRPRRGNSQRDHVSVPCGAGGRGGGGCRPLSPPVFTLLRQQTPLSCAAAGVDEGQVQDGLPALSGEHESPCLSLLLPPSCWTPAWVVCHSSDSGCWSLHAMEGGSVSSRAPAESEKGLTVIRVGGRAGPPEKGGTPARHEGVESHCQVVSGWSPWSGWWHEGPRV